MTMAGAARPLRAALTGRRPLLVALVLATGAASGLAASASSLPISVTWLILLAVLAAAAIRPDIALLKLTAVAFLLPFAVAPIRLGVQPPIFELGLAAVVASVLLRGRLRPVGLPKLSPADPRLWVSGFLLAGLVSNGHFTCAVLGTFSSSNMPVSLAWE